MNNEQFYESMFDYGSGFYSHNEWECDELLKKSGVESNGSEAGIELFEYLYQNDIHYNQFLKLISNFEDILTKKCMISRIIINVFNKFGLNFEEDLKSVLKNIVKELKNDKNLQDKYDIKQFENYQDLVKQDEGSFYIYTIFCDYLFINYI